MTDETNELFDDSRRSFMKKGALATTAVALGASATSGSAAAQEDDNGNNGDAEGDVLVYGDDYHPGADFDVVTELSTSSREELLQESGSEDDVFDDPDDWDVFVINYDFGTEAPMWGLVFTEDAELNAGDTATMGEDGDFRDTQLNLVEATLGATGDDAEEEDVEEEEEDVEEEEEDIEEEEEDIDDTEDDTEDEENDNGIFD